MADLGARRRVLELVVAFRQTQCVRVAAELELADHLLHGPRSAEELASATGAYAPFLRRLLRALTALGLVEVLPDERYGLTALGGELTEGRLRGAARMFGSEPLWSAWECLDHAVRTGDRAFDHAHGTDIWDHFASRPRDAERFDTAMAGLTAGSAQAVADAVDFGRYRSVVDVGGGDGTLLAEILRRAPEARGVLVDVGHALDQARDTLEAAGVRHRAELHDGDFRRSVPAGADCYVLKWILHDWDDEQATTILRCCREAAPSDARLVVVERVVPERVGPEDAEVVLADLNMMVLTGGKERTASEFDALLADGGWRLETVRATGAGLGVLEATPRE